MADFTPGPSGAVVSPSRTGAMDDGPILQDLANNSDGVVDLRGRYTLTKRLNLASRVTFPAGINLRCDGMVFTCNDVNAGITFLGDGGPGAKESGGFRIDGNAIANQPLIIDAPPAGLAGAQRSFRNIDVLNALLDNWTIFTPQNMRFWNCNAYSAGRDNFLFDKGSAGHVFVGSEIRAAGRYGVRFTETGHTGGAGKPGNIEFIGSIIELNANDSLVYVEYLGSQLRFIHTSFAVGAGNFPLVLLNEAVAGDISTAITFDDCEWYAVGTSTAPAMFRATVPAGSRGVVKATFKGYHHAQGAGATPVIDSPDAAVNDRAHYDLLFARRASAGSRVIAPGDNLPAGIVAPQPIIGSAGNVGLANNCYVARVVPIRDITVTQMSFGTANAATANDSCDVGIYNSDLSVLLVSSGSTAGKLNVANTTQTIAIAPTTLKAGTVYYLAFAYGAVGGTAAQLVHSNAIISGASLFGAAVPNLIQGKAAAGFPLAAAPAGIAAIGNVPVLAARE